MNITKTTGTIINVRNMSTTAREITISLASEIEINPGCFMNMFFNDNNERVRRAYSVASDYANTKEIQIAVRRKDTGRISPLFWNTDIIGTDIEVMGPLGLNTIDKMQSNKVFLVGFGVGVSVLKALLYGLRDRKEVEEIHIITGNRDDDEILYKHFFDEQAKNDARVSVRYVLTESKDASYPYIGYAQQHIADYDFADADVYVCGQEIACDALQAQVKEQTSDMSNVHFFVEAFH